MRKISLLSLLIHASIYPMLAPVLQLAKRLPVISSSKTSAGIRQSGRLTLKQRNVSDDTRSLTKFLSDFEPEIVKVDPTILGLLAHDAYDRWGDLLQKTDWQKQRKRIAIGARLLGKDFADSQINRAVKEQDYELTRYLLSKGGKPQYTLVNTLDIALTHKDHRMVELLLAHEKESAYPLTDLSFEEIKVFLERGAQVANIRIDGEPVSPIGCLEGIEMLGQEWYGIDGDTLNDTQKRDLLKKVILLTRAGDPLTFRVRNPMGEAKSLAKLGYYSGRISCCVAEGDWTIGHFTDLAEYTQAVMQSRNAMSIEEKAEAGQTMAAIMHKWDITEEDVAVVPKYKKEI